MDDKDSLRFHMARAMANLRKYDEALAVYSQLQEMNPDNLGILPEIAGIHLAQNKYADAAREFETILSQDTVSVELKLRIGELYFSQVGKDSTLAPLARTIYERITQKHPDDWRAYWFLGALGGVLHDDSLSVRNFRRVTQLASWNADAWVYLSSVFLGKNNFGEVVQILETALKVVPDDFRVNFFLGFAYSRLGRNTDAARVLERACQINPKDIEAVAQLALVYDGLKKTNERTRIEAFMDQVCDHAARKKPLPKAMFW